jgi:hypothetical protein
VEKHFYQSLKEHWCALCENCEAIQKPRPAQFYGQSIEWVETARYLGVTLDSQVAWTVEDNQIGRKVAYRLECFAHYTIGEVTCPSTTTTPTNQPKS